LSILESAGGGALRWIKEAAGAGADAALRLPRAGV